MMVRPSPAWFAVVFTAGLVLGLAVGSAAFGGLGFFVTGDPSTDGGVVDPDSPSYSVGTGTGCLSSSTANSGWIHEVANGPNRGLTANLTVAHAPDKTVDSRFERVGEGVYQFRVAIVTTDKGGSPDCQTGSTIDLSASIPTEYDRVEVVVDGQHVASMVNDGDTTADLTTFTWRGT